MNQQSTAIELLDRCIAKAAQDFLDGKEIDTKSLQALAGAVNQITMYAKYRENEAALDSSLKHLHDSAESGAAFSEVVDECVRYIDDMEDRRSKHSLRDEVDELRRGRPFGRL